jgi:hypothetical protein
LPQHHFVLEAWQQMHRSQNILERHDAQWFVPLMAWAGFYPGDRATEPGFHLLDNY